MKYLSLLLLVIFVVGGGLLTACCPGGPENVLLQGAVTIGPLSPVEMPGQVQTVRSHLR